MLRNVPDSCNFEVEVVAIGSGAGGLSAAITAHEYGASALVVEKSGQAGGVTALSMGAFGGRGMGRGKPPCRSGRYRGLGGKRL